MLDSDALDWTHIKKHLQSLASSEPAREKLIALSTCGSAREATRSFHEIVEAMGVLQQGLRPRMQSLDLFSTWIPRLKKNAVLKNLEIKDVRHFCLECIALKEALTGVSNDWCQTHSRELMDAEKPLSAIDQILTPGGEIRIDASERLYRLHEEKDRLARDVHQTLDHLVKDHQMENLLQDKYVTTRDGRWVLPVKGGMQHYMPGVIHGTSQTKQTVFMEPEKVIPMNNRLRQIDVEIEDEIERLLTDLSQYLSALTAEFDQSRGTMERVDIRLAQAQMGAQLDARPVDFVEDKIHLLDAKHPLLQLSGKPVVANSILLNSQKTILLLSGPNAGGKTVLLKTIGLTAQMARCGLLTCTGEGSQIPFFEKIEIAIGDSQSVDQDLSTFAAHLKILQKASETKGPRNLILVDEICGSTDPEEGSALARSFIESFAENQTYAVVTSHLGPLKTGWGENSRVLNGSLEYDTATGRPTYQFISGLAGDSLAIQTAKRVGVSQVIVGRALALLSPATQERLRQQEDLERIKADIILLQENLRKEQQRVKVAGKKYEAKLLELEQQKEEWLAKTVRKAEKKVDEAIQNAQAEDVFKRHRQLQEIKFQLPEMVKAKPIQTVLLSDTVENFSLNFPPGTKVFVPSLGQDALIQSAPNGKGEVMILSGSVRLQISWKDLRPAGRPQNPTAQLVRRSGTVTAIGPDDDRAIDLRGKTVSEALEDLEMALDTAALHKEDRLKVIHGHGTEALKKAVRIYLSRSVYVKKWKAGTSDTGGDGVTWVELGS